MQMHILDVKTTPLLAFKTDDDILNAKFSCKYNRECLTENLFSIQNNQNVFSLLTENDL